MHITRPFSFLYCITPFFFYLVFNPSAFGQAIECTGFRDDLKHVDFTSSTCTQVNLDNYQMSDYSVWLQVTLPPIENNMQSFPLSLYLSGSFSAMAYLNGQLLGNKGQPGLTPEEELMGPFDWSIYVPPRLLSNDDNTLTLYLSSHHFIFGTQANVNRLALKEYGNTTANYFIHYAPLLVPLGAMLITLTYLTSRPRAAFEASDFYLLLLLILVSIAQLALEMFRGVYAYPYPVHVPRMLMIAVCSLLFGQALLQFFLGAYLSNQKKRIGLASSVLTLVTMFCLDDFDYKAIAAIQIPCATGIIAWGLAWKKSKPVATRVEFRWFLLIFVTLLVVTFFTQNSFLDIYFYYFIAAVLVALTRLESDRVKRLNDSLSEAKQQADQLRLALALSNGPTKKQTIKLKSAGQVIVIDTQELLFCKGAGDYVELVCKDKTLLHSGSLRELQNELPAEFIKVHRSYIVNATKIKTLKRKISGNGELLLVNELTVPVSRALFNATKAVFTAL